MFEWLVCMYAFSIVFVRCALVDATGGGGILFSVAELHRSFPYFIASCLSTTVSVPFKFLNL